MFYLHQKLICRVTLNILTNHFRGINNDPLFVRSEYNKDINYYTHVRVTHLSGLNTHVSSLEHNAILYAQFCDGIHYTLQNTPLQSQIALYVC